jgi:uncharacterized protein
MAISTMPQEIVTWYLLPAVRKQLAQDMIRGGKSQREVARALGITDAAVSQYVSGKRASDLALEPSVRKMVKRSAEMIASGADAMGEINGICKFCMEKYVLCRMHKAHGAPRKCDICFRKVA